MKEKAKGDLYLVWESKVKLYIYILEYAWDCSFGLNLAFSLSLADIV